MRGNGYSSTYAYRQAIAFLCSVLAMIGSSETLAHSAPIWCPDGPVSGMQAGEYKPGEFPGPPDNHKMYRVDLAEFDLTQEFNGLPGRDMRARFWLMEPGGMIQEHCHEDRPALVYILEGRVVETKMEGSTVTTNILPPPNWSGGPFAVAEGNGTRHWWKNEGTAAVVMVAVDLPLRQPIASDQTANWQWRVSNLPKEPKAISADLNEKLDLTTEYPHIEYVHGREVRGTHWTFEPGAVLGELDHSSRPAIIYVVVGEVLDVRSDHPQTQLLRAGDGVTGHNGVKRYLYNATDAPAEIVVFEIIDSSRQEAD